MSGSWSNGVMLRQKGKEIMESLGGKSGFNKIRLKWIVRLTRYGIVNAEIIVDELVQDCLKKMIQGTVDISSNTPSYKERLDKYIKDNLGKYISCNGTVTLEDFREQKGIGGNKGESLDYMEEQGVFLAYHFDTPEHNAILEEKIKKLLAIKDKLCKKKNSPACRIVNSLIYQNTYSDEELAEMLHVEVNTVIKTRSRIKEMLLN